PPQPSPLFPYTTLFRSCGAAREARILQQPLVDPHLEHAPRPATRQHEPGSARSAPALAWSHHPSPPATGKPSSCSGSFAMRATRSEEHTSELQSPCNLV